MNVVIAQFDLVVNSRTFKQLSLFKYFQSLEFGEKIKYFQGLSRMHGNPMRRLDLQKISTQLFSNSKLNC